MLEQRRHIGGAATMLLLALLWTMGTRPAAAHEGEEGEDPVALVEQALAILVNTPDSVDEARERIEAVLAEEPEELEAIDVDALTRALEALEAGEFHAAEDALIEALGQDPHPEAEEGDGVLATPVLGHGLTERLGGGFRSPSTGALVLAVALAAGGTLLLRRRSQ